MDYTEKINIYVQKHIIEALENDAIMFEIFKKDGKTPNKNRLLNLILAGFYEEYCYNSNTAYEKIISSMSETDLSEKEKIQISKKILKDVVLPPIFISKEKGLECLSLKPQAKNAGIINDMRSSASIYADKDESISKSFCRMLVDYCNKPISYRERIIFKTNYDKIISARSGSYSIRLSTIWNPKYSHEVIPYKIVTSVEETFNYVLCAEINPKTGEQEARSFRLNRINTVLIYNNKHSINSTTKKHLDRMVQLGAAYSINDEEEACVQLNSNGVNNYKRISYGRPKYYHIEKISDDLYHYFFKCSKDQLFMYFRRFGKDAKILSPESLVLSMKEYYKDALSIYL